MPSVFTIEGSGLGKHKRKHKRKRKHKSLAAGGRCKWVRQKGGYEIQLCHIGKSKRHPSGWSFMPGTRRKR